LYVLRIGWLKASVFATDDNDEGKRRKQEVISVQKRDNAKFYAGHREQFACRKKSEQSCVTFLELLTIRASSIIPYLNIKLK
jgi:hypothetical protein